LLSEIEIYEALTTRAIEIETVSTKFASSFSTITVVNKERRSMLTKTEKKVIVGLFLGLAAKEIARTRKSSSRTVEGHIASIKQKLGVKKLSGIHLSIIFEECLNEGFG